MVGSWAAAAAAAATTESGESKLVLAELDLAAGGVLRTCCWPWWSKYILSCGGYPYGVDALEQEEFDDPDE